MNPAGPSALAERIACGRTVSVSCTVVLSGTGEDAARAVVAEQRGRGGDDSGGEQRREGEQAHLRGGDLGHDAEADHGNGESEVGGEVDARERFAAVRRG